MELLAILDLIVKIFTADPEPPPEPEKQEQEESPRQ